MSNEPKPVMIDANGDKWWNFLFSYDWEGKEYAFDICARSEQEARERLKRLPLARYDGQGHGGPIPLSRGGFLVPLIAWWKNFKTKR